MLGRGCCAVGVSITDRWYRKDRYHRGMKSWETGEWLHV